MSCGSGSARRSASTFEVGSGGPHDRPPGPISAPAVLHEGGRVPAPGPGPPPRGHPGRRPGRSRANAAPLARCRGADPGRRESRRPAPDVPPVPLVRRHDRRPGPAGGTQHDVRVLVPGDDVDSTAIAAYVAKYATKTADGTAWLAHPIRSAAQLERLELRPHVVSLVRTAWALGRRKDLSHLRLRAHAHTLGYTGQFSSKSQRFSTTFTALRHQPGRVSTSTKASPPTSATTTASGATPGGATTTPRRIGWRILLLEAARERAPTEFPTPSQFSSCKRHDQGKRLSEKFHRREPLREPFDAQLRAGTCFGSMAPWHHSARPHHGRTT